MVIDDTWSVEDTHAFIYCKKGRFGRVSRMPQSLTDSQRKDSATQLLIKYKSGALVTQLVTVQGSVGQLSLRIPGLPSFLANTGDPAVVPFKICKHSIPILLPLYVNFQGDEKEQSAQMSFQYLLFYL